MIQVGGIVECYEGKTLINSTRNKESSGRSHYCTSL